MNRRIAILVLGLSVLMVLAGCTRERPAEAPPIHLNPNMDQQPRVDPQEKSVFFEDGLGMRAPVPGTVPRGWLRDSAEYYTGMNSRGDTVKTMPVELTLSLLKRGRERYDIYCGPCHSRVGDGKGIMIQRGYVPPPSFHDDRIRDFRDGYIFHVISHGVRNMPGYRYQIPVEDRWAIVAYVRALQYAKNASGKDIPTEVLDVLKKSGS
jgi:hypothetical protein